jgi:hypothetical protein
MQRRKPRALEYQLAPTKHNPNRVLVLSVGHPPELQIWYYKNQPKYFFIATYGNFINIPTEYLQQILKALRQLKKQLQQT